MLVMLVKLPSLTPWLLSFLLLTGYVDVVHDGLTGIRTTGSSMDLGSSGRGPGSVAGSLSGFHALGHSFTALGASPRTLGASPRSPLGFGFTARAAAGRSGSAPAAAAVVDRLATAPEGVEEGSDGTAAAAAIAAPLTPQPEVMTAAPSRLGPGAAAARPSSAPPAAAASQAGYAPAMAAIAATVAAASRSGSRRSSDAYDDGSSSRQRGPSREVNSFRVRVSSESMGPLSEEFEHDEPAAAAAAGVGVHTAPAGQPGSSGDADLFDMA